ncbi:hypothetical protein [uncultured Clostridium sp.]|mgnify:CR=1 FL=1|uniref:hypothetical protein n=1 Tax=uncultured Clostridium sp. TaxID=59620 RepID=UPI00262E3C29|nr:hypothetical protein [uncultured Clostridium sp.]
MEEVNEKLKPPVTLREVVTDWAINSFFGFYMVYWWLGTESSKLDITTAFGIKFFAITKAMILLISMGCAILGGYRLFKILIRLKKSVKFIDIGDDVGKIS